MILCGTGCLLFLKESHTSLCQKLQNVYIFTENYFSLHISVFIHAKIEI